MKIAALVVAVALGTLAVSGWHARQQSSTPTHPVSLDVTSSTHAAPADTGMLRLTGQVQPKTRVSIRSTVSRPIVDLPFREGDRVIKGGVQGSTPVPASVLVRLDDRELKAALRAAEARRDAQAAEIEAAHMRLTVLESQVASSHVGLGDRLQSEYAAAVRGYAASKANLPATEAEVERARRALAAATISSPIDGVITRVNVNVGEVVTGTVQKPGTILMEVADMEHIALIAHLDEESVGKVKAGQKATVHLKAYGNRTFSGTVENVALSSTEGKDGSRYFKAEIRLDTGGRVIPAGLSGEALIDCETRQ